MSLTTTPLKLKDAALINCPPFSDERGFLCTPYVESLLLDNGIHFPVVQLNWTQNLKAGTIRGIHFQKSPHEQGKLVYCVSGSIVDLLLDLRPDSDTYMQWQMVELSSKVPQGVYVPKGFGHAFQTLEDSTTVLYLMDGSYAPQSNGGYRYNDAAFGIKWPLPATVVSTQDQGWPDFQR